MLRAIQSLKAKHILLWAVMLAVGLFGLVSTTFAVGVSPAFTDGGQLRRENSVKRSVTISRANPDKAAYYSVKAEGEGSKYVKLSSDILEVPEGKNKVSFSFNIEPETAANGTYSANLRFIATLPPKQDGETSGQSVAILEGVVAKLVFTVTDEEILDYTIVQTSVDDVEEDLPIVFVYDLQNTGNVDARPDKIEVAVFNADTSEKLFSDTVSSDKLEFIEPAARKRTAVSLDRTLDQGRYFMDIKIYQGDELMYERSRLRFEVFPSGTFQRNAEFLDIKLNVDSVPVNGLVKFDARIKNTGAIAIEPQLFIELKKGNKTVEFIETDKRVLRKGQTTTFTETYRPSAAGRYTAVAYFEYGGVKRTAEKTVTFYVGSTIQPVHIILVGAGLLLIFIIILLLIKKKHHKNGGSGMQDSTSQTMNTMSQSNKDRGNNS